MKKSVLILGFLVLAGLLSCATSPKADAPVAAVAAPAAPEPEASIAAPVESSPTIEPEQAAQVQVEVEEAPMVPPEERSIPLFEPAVSQELPQPPPAPPAVEPAPAPMAAPPPASAAPPAAPPAVPAAPPAARAAPPQAPKAAAEPRQPAPLPKPVESVAPPSVERAPVPVPAAPVPELPARTPPTAVEEPIVYSRTVRATVGQLIEVPFYGAGWVFLGELGSRKGLPYDSRRLDRDGQTFMFRAEAPGTYALKFFRQDFVKDFILNDHVQVVVGEAPAATGVGGFSLPVDRGRVSADPRWPRPGSASSPAAPAAAPSEPPRVAPVAPATTPTVPVATPTAPIAPTAPTVAPAAAAAAPPAVVDAGVSPLGSVQAAVPPADPATPEEYLARARREYDAGTFAAALATLDGFRERFPGGSDEAWWLYGRVLEASGPQRDIKSALAYYKRLTAEYPQSSRYADARSRIAYLERYYFNIR